MGLERWNSTQEARVQIRVSTNRIYYRADTALLRKEGYNMACVVHSGFAIATWTIWVPHKERHNEFMHSPQASPRFHRRLDVYTYTYQRLKLVINDNTKYGQQ
jgi:hypothetical protein